MSHRANTTSRSVPMMVSNFNADPEIDARPR